MVLKSLQNTAVGTFSGVLIALCRSCPVSPDATRRIDNATRTAVFQRWFTGETALAGERGSAVWLGELTSL